MEQVALVPAALLLDGEKARVSDVQFHGGLAAVTVNGGQGGFVLLDASDACDIKVLSRYWSGTSDNWYTKFTRPTGGSSSSRPTRQAPPRRSRRRASTSWT